MKKTTVRRAVYIVSAVLVFGAMLYIFINSAMDAEQSGAQSGWITQVLSKIFLSADPSREEMAKLESVLRTLGHFSEFMFLGLVTAILISFLIQCDPKKWYGYACGWIFCIIYALTDEWHQMFVPGRAAEWKDVLTDSFGSLTGILIIATIFLTFVRKRFYQKSISESDSSDQENGETGEAAPDAGPQDSETTGSNG